MGKESALEALFGENVDPRETRAAVDECLREFELGEGLKESTLRLVFDQWPGNTDESEVLAKVTLLNVFYSTRLNDYASPKSDRIDIEGMARAIAGIDGFDELLHSDDEDERMRLVELIRHGGTAGEDGRHYDDAYSFATKYCSWHCPDKYPIADSYSRGMVYRIACLMRGATRTPNGLRQEDLLDYKTFCDRHSEAREYICQRAGAEYTPKEIDEFFWVFGKSHGLGIS